MSVFLFYTQSIVSSLSTFIFYCIVNTIFSFVGFIFSYYFKEFTIRALYEETLYGNSEYYFPASNRMNEKQRQFRRNIFYYKVTLKNSFRRIFNSRKSLLIFTLFLIPIIIIGIDAQVGIFTPNISFIDNVVVRYPENNLLLNIQIMPNSNLPQVVLNGSKLAYTSIVIRSGSINQLDSVNVLLSNYLESRKLNVVNSHSEITSWDELEAFAPYPFNKELSIEVLNNANGLQINYSKKANQSFNVTLAYWVNADIDRISVNTKPINCISFNETFYKWTYSFQISNNQDTYYTLRELQFDQWLFNDVNETIAGLTIDGNKIDYLRIYENVMSLDFPQNIKAGQTVSIEVTYLSQDKL